MPIGTKDPKKAFLGIRSDPEQRRLARLRRLRRKAERGKPQAMAALQQLESWEAQKKKQPGVTDAALRQAASLAEEQAGAQAQGLMAQVAPIGTMGQQEGITQEQLQALAEAGQAGTAATTGQAFETASRLAAQGQEAYLARLQRSGEFEQQRAAQMASMLIGGAGAMMGGTGAVLGGIGALA